MISYNRYIYISFPSKRLDCYASRNISLMETVTTTLFYVIMHVNAGQGTFMCHAASHATSRLLKQYVAT